jgi:hypothetical protein
MTIPAQSAASRPDYHPTRISLLRPHTIRRPRPEAVRAAQRAELREWVARSHQLCGDDFVLEVLREVVDDIEGVRSGAFATILCLIGVLAAGCALAALCFIMWGA